MRPLLLLPSLVLLALVAVLLFSPAAWAFRAPTRAALSAAAAAAASSRPRSPWLPAMRSSGGLWTARRPFIDIGGSTGSNGGGGGDPFSLVRRFAGSGGGGEEGSGSSGGEEGEEGGGLVEKVGAFFQDPENRKDTKL